MLLSYKAQAERRASELGCSWDHAGPYTVVLDAPRGMVFRSTGTHAISLGDLEYLTEAEAYRGALHDMAMGLDSCRDHDCDVCA